MCVINILYLFLSQISFKIEGIIESGGQAKWFLQDVEVLINGVRETRRGKKLEHQDRIDIPELPEDAGSFLIIHQGEQ